MSRNLKQLVPAFSGCLLIMAGALLNPWNRFLFALILFLGAMFSYFYVIFALSDRNWMDVRALFAVVWLFTLSLASLRLTDYQKPWAAATWVLSALGYGFFQLGALSGIFCGKKVFLRLKNQFKEKCSGFAVKENRLFWVCFAVGLIGLCCFVINVWIKGFIPCFSDNYEAYRLFYTKFHVFAVAATMVSGLCYYCLKTQEMSLWKRIVLWFLIVYNVILFPIMVVSRGVFVVSAIVFSTVFFYMNKKSLLALIFCLVVIASVYLLTSSLRSLTDDYLNMIFTPSKIEIEVQEETKETEISTEEDLPGDSLPEQPSTFQLSPKAVFLYGYLTVSHDNFNEAVIHSESCSWGIRQLKPLKVFLRSAWFSDQFNSLENYLVSPSLNTVNFFGIFYYDFHAFGVIFFSFLWAFVFGMIQSAYSTLKGPFSLMVLGNAMNPVILSFFASWVDSFDLWMFWGTILILFLMSSVKINKKNKSMETRK